jgi:hypothetical protein
VWSTANSTASLLERKISVRPVRLSVCTGLPTGNNGDALYQFERAVFGCYGWRTWFFNLMLIALTVNIAAGALYRRAVA